MESTLLFERQVEVGLTTSIIKVLLAVCDTNYEFTIVDIGDSGRQSDGGMYANSKLGYAIVMTF